MQDLNLILDEVDLDMFLAPESLPSVIFERADEDDDGMIQALIEMADELQEKDLQIDALQRQVATLKAEIAQMREPALVHRQSTVHTTCLSPPSNYQWPLAQPWQQEK